MLRALADPHGLHPSGAGRSARRNRMRGLRSVAGFDARGSAFRRLGASGGALSPPSRGERDGPGVVSSPTMQTLAADLVVTMKGETLAPGWVTVERGRILEVGEGRPPERPLELAAAAGPTVMLPGFVTAHAHLPLGGLRALSTDRGFWSWIQEGVLPGIRALEEDPAAFLHGARLSVEELLRGGVTAVGDAFLRSEGVRACRERGMGGVFFQEVFGSLAEDEDAYLEEIFTLFDRLEEETAGHPFGYSPHAPWTCPPQVMSRVVARARSEGRRISIHLAESREEDAFFKEERGPIHELWLRRGILSRFAFGASPVQLLSDLGILGPEVLAVHCVRCDEEDIGLLAAAGVHVVHCPVSNMLLGEGVAPVHAMLEAGIPVCLGTDSTASTGRLDMFAEMRAFLQAQRALTGSREGLTGRRALRMATLSGAEALGLADHKGSLEAGKDADLMIVDLGSLASPWCGDLLDVLVHGADPGHVALVMSAGKVCFDRAARS